MEEEYVSQYFGEEIDQGIGVALAINNSNGLIKSDGEGGVSSATPGTDFVAPVTGATQGNFAMFDATGNPVDLGKGPRNFTPVPLVSVVSMVATNWSSGVYSFEAEYPHESYDIRISIAPSATEEEYDAFCEAKICGNATENTYTAKGIAPSLNVPIILEVYPK